MFSLYTRHRRNIGWEPVGIQYEYMLEGIKEREEGFLDPRENTGHQELKHDYGKRKPYDSKDFHGSFEGGALSGLTQAACPNQASPSRLKPNVNSACPASRISPSPEGVFYRRSVKGLHLY